MLNTDSMDLKDSIVSRTIRREIAALNAICVWIGLRARAKSTIVKGSWQNGSQMPMLNLLSNGLYRHGIIPLDRFCGGMLYRSPARISIQRTICFSHALAVLKIMIYLLYIVCLKSNYTLILDIKKKIIKFINKLVFIRNLTPGELKKVFDNKLRYKLRLVCTLIKVISNIFCEKCICVYITFNI